MVQFDEYFEAMLQKGDRETCARYRNCIIDELRQREECKNNAVQIGNVLDSLYEEIVRTKRSHVASTVLSLVGVIAALGAALYASAQGFTVLKVCAIILMVANSYDFLRLLIGSLMLSSIQKEAKATVIHVTKAPHTNSDFPESFRTILADSDEALYDKKQTLDEFLGF